MVTGEPEQSEPPGPFPCGLPAALRLGKRTWAAGSFGIMAVINRTPDSFYDNGATYGFAAALEAAGRAIADGADILDIGGVKAGPGEHVGVHEEIDRVTGLVSAVREAHPDVVISVDTWRAEVGEVVARAGADLLNDAWGGADPRLVEVAAAHGLGLVCSHAGGLSPRTRPHRPAYRDLLAGVTGYLTAEAERALAAGVRRDGIVIDPAHDFGKNTWHSLEITRRTADLVATGWPVLVALSNKDFIGESLGLPVRERGEGSLAAVAVCAWEGARLFRVHDVAGTREVLDVVESLREEWGQRPEGTSRR